MESVPPFRFTIEVRVPMTPPRLASFETTRLPAVMRQEVPTMADVDEATTPAVVLPAISRIPGPVLANKAPPVTVPPLMMLPAMRITPCWVLTSRLRG